MSIVYFVSPENGGPIRVGCCSIPVASRIRSLNTLYPDRLALLGAIPGYTVREAMLLLRFRRQKVRGDWFRPTLELWKLVGEAAETGDLDGMPAEPEHRVAVEESVAGLQSIGFDVDTVCRLLRIKCKPGRLPPNWRDNSGAPANLQALHLGLASGWLCIERDFTPTPEPAPC